MRAIGVGRTGDCGAESHSTRVFVQITHDCAIKSHDWIELREVARPLDVATRRYTLVPRAGYTL